MKNTKLLAVLGSICLVLVLAALPFLAACAAPAPPEPIVLKAITFLPTTHASCRQFIEYTDLVNKAAKGELIINVVGGPEAIPAFDQFEALQTGLVDIAENVTGYYKREIPAGGSMLLSKLTWSEMRESGWHDFMIEIHKEKNVFYLGQALPTGSAYFNLYSKVRISNPKEDFKGLKFRSVPTYDPILQALGISRVTLALPDVYTALDRGLVDGFAASPGDPVQFHLWEVCKYRIDPGIYHGQAVSIVNLDTWNALPKHLQDLLIEIQLERELVWEADNIGEMEELRELALAKGMEAIKLSPADEKWYVETAYATAWEDLEKICSPEDYSRVRETLRVE